MNLAEHVVDVLLEAVPSSLRVNLRFALDGHDDELVLPGLVSVESAPKNTYGGAWRLTVFDAKKTMGLLHINFELDGQPTLEKVQQVLGPDHDAYEYLLGDINDWLESSSGEFATDFSVEGVSAPPA